MTKFFSDKRNQLAKIRSAARTTQTKQLGPRLGLAVSVGMATALVIFAACLALKVQAPLAVLGIALALGLLAAGVTYRLAHKLPKTNVDRLDELLAQYEPLHTKSLSALQASIRASGTYNIDDVQEWIALEERAVSVSESVSKPRSSKFLDRKFSE